MRTASFYRNDAVDICLKQVSEQPASVSERVEHEISKDIEALIMQCLQKSPEKRHDSAAALEASLKQCNSYEAWTSQDASHWWDHHDELSASSESSNPQAVNDPTMIIPREEIFQQ